jgi:hypothetical protein
MRHLVKLLLRNKNRTRYNFLGVRYDMGAGTITIPRSKQATTQMAQSFDDHTRN